MRKADDGPSSGILFSRRVGGHATGYAVLELVRLIGVTQILHLKRKNQIGYVEYWNAGCGESRTSGVDAGKGVSPTYAYKVERPYLSLHRIL
jgi:hypothetical protein